jgi:hypothetical protein
VTFFLSYFAPYLVFGIVLGIFSLAGASHAEWRTSVSEFAGMDPDGWASLGRVWRAYATLLSAGVLAWRIWTCSFVRAKRSELDEVVSRSINLFGDRLLARFRPSSVVGRFHRSSAGQWLVVNPTPVSVIAIMVVSVACIGALLIIRPDKPAAAPQPLGASPLLAKRIELRSSAAIVLTDGSIISGDVTARRDAQGNYVLSFDPPQAQAATAAHPQHAE